MFILFPAAAVKAGDAEGEILSSTLKTFGLKPRGKL
jgi:hypothetical protein